MRLGPDCPLSLGQLTVNALTAADATLLVSEPRAAIVEGLAQIATTRPGKPPASADPTPAIAGGNPYRYAGGYTDTTTGLIKFGARYYNPALGRWTQLDSLNSLLDFANGNRYAYAGDDPIKRKRPHRSVFSGA